MRSGLLFALLICSLPLSQRAMAADLIGDLLQASNAAPSDATPSGAASSDPIADAIADPPPLDGRRRPGRPQDLPPPELPQVNPKGIDAPPPDAFPAAKINPSLSTYTSSSRHDTFVRT